MSDLFTGMDDERYDYLFDDDDYISEVEYADFVSEVEDER